MSLIHAVQARCTTLVRRRRAAPASCGTLRASPDLPLTAGPADAYTADMQYPSLRRA